ncbi:MAG: hypothetical protein KF845_03725 [Cyclobacteriaceae bacterium]|nr:hypothetical protein [Cyclobacteriaceae bacterium]
MIEQKIRLIERQPVSWNKEETWLRVQKQVAPTAKRYRVYYYAAAVIFFVLFGVRGVHYLKNDSLVNPDENAVTEIVTETIPSIEKEVVQEKVIAPEPVYELHTEHKHVSPMANAQETTVLPDTKIEIDLEVEELLLSFSEEVHPQKVMPIVGVITDPVYDKVVNVKPKRKKLFHKLEPGEKKISEDYQNTIIIARIK